MKSIEKYLQSKGYSKSTIKCYHTEIMEFIVWCDKENIEPENTTGTEVTGYLKHLQNKGQNNKTRNVNLNILKHYFNYLISTEAREDNPAKQIKIRGVQTKQLHTIFTKPELENIYHNYKTLEETDEKSNRNWFKKSLVSKKRNKAILSLMIYQGLTTDEVNRLTTADIKLKEGKIFIAGTRKSNERELELKPHQIMELMEYQLTTRKELLQYKAAAGSPPSGELEGALYFIPSPSAGKQTTTNNDGINIWKRLRDEIRACNKKFVNFQQVRASVITHWLKQYNLRQVQYMAGHRYVSSTENYLANQMEDLQKDIENYHPIG